MANPPPDDARHAAEIIAQRYAQQIKAHGDTAAGFFWPNESDREVRNDVMLDVIDPRAARPLVLLDLGCGSGDLFGHIQRRGLDGIVYRGVDSSERAIDLARATYPEADFELMDVGSPAVDFASTACDYLVSNGMFTTKFEATYEQMWELLESTLARVWPFVRRGIAFNVMSKVVDWERDDLFHVPMDDLARLLHGLAGRRVRFRADYGLYEYTAYACKAEPEGEPA